MVQVLIGSGTDTAPDQPEIRLHPFTLDNTFHSGLRMGTARGSTAGEVANIRGVNRAHVDHLINDGASPNAHRGQPTRARCQTGRWIIPRQDVYAYRHQAKDQEVV